MRGVEVNGAAVTTARVNSGLTQEQLASEAAMDVKTVRKAEQGKRLDLGFVTKLAYALKTDLRMLVVPSDEETGLQVVRRNVALQWNRAWDDGDVAAMEPLYHDDAVLKVHGEPHIPFAGTYHGKAQVLAVQTGAWAQVRHDPMRVEDFTIHVSNDAITLKGEKIIHPPGRDAFRFQCVQLFTFRGPLIAEHEVLYDTLAFAQLFGFVA